MLAPEGPVGITRSVRSPATGIAEATVPQLSSRAAGAAAEEAHTHFHGCTWPTDAAGAGLAEAASAGAIRSLA
jgi:hypothetical protein